MGSITRRANRLAATMQQMILIGDAFAETACECAKSSEIEDAMNNAKAAAECYQLAVSLRDSHDAAISAAAHAGRFAEAVSHDKQTGDFQ